jgi:hypothetical protein
MGCAVYLLILENPGYRPKIFIGSGTNTKSSVSSQAKRKGETQHKPAAYQLFFGPQSWILSTDYCFSLVV